MAKADAAVRELDRHRACAGGSAQAHTCEAKALGTVFLFVLRSCDSPCLLSPPTSEDDSRDSSSAVASLPGGLYSDSSSSSFEIALTTGGVPT